MSNTLLRNPWLIAIVLVSLCDISRSMSSWDPDQFFSQQPIACTPDGKVWIFEYLGFWYQSPQVCFRYFLRTESRQQPPCTDFDEQTFGTDYHVTLELPITACKGDLEEYITNLFKEPYPFLVVEHQDVMHLQFDRFSYYEWNKQYGSDQGQVYSVCLTNFELGTTTFDGKALLTVNSASPITSDSVITFNDMEVPDLCSVFDYKLEQSQGTTVSDGNITDNWQSGDDRIIDGGIQQRVQFEIPRDEDVIYRDATNNEAQLGQGRVDQNDMSGWLMPPRNNEKDIDESFPRSYTNVGNDFGDDDSVNSGESDKRRGDFRRTDGMTEEEWSAFLNQWRGKNKNKMGHDDDRRAVGPQEWKQIVDAYHSHNDSTLSYPGRRLLEQNRDGNAPCNHGDD